MSSGPPVQPPYQDPYGQQPQGGPPPPQYPQQQYQAPPQNVQYPHPPAPTNVVGRAGKFQGAFPCPRCGSPYVQDVTFTWWGGLVGPATMNLVKCNGCKLQYNAKTLKDATTAITLYAVIGTVVGLVLGLLFFFVLRR